MSAARAGGAVAVVLAAGGSRRLGRPKQLVRHAGEPLVRGAARAALGSTCARVVVVVGAASGEVRAALDGLDVDVVENDAWSEGVASSVRAGVAAAERGGADAVVILACDQPRITAAHVDRLVRAHRPGTRAVASRYAGTVGIPALFDRAAFPALGALRGDRGAKRVLADSAGLVAIDWPDGALDVDTEEDARALASDGAVR